MEAVVVYFVAICTNMEQYAVNYRNIAGVAIKILQYCGRCNQYIAIGILQYDWKTIYCSLGLVQGVSKLTFHGIGYKHCFTRQQ